MFFEVDQGVRSPALRVEQLDGKPREIECDLGFV